MRTHDLRHNEEEEEEGQEENEEQEAPRQEKQEEVGKWMFCRALRAASNGGVRPSKRPDAARALGERSDRSGSDRALRSCLR
ncbi:MAG: hypothetical protein ACYCUM_00010 [Solirubrobacteraceae bacterium]